MSENILENPVALGAIGIVVLLVVVLIVMKLSSGKKSGSSAGGGSGGGAASSNGAAAGGGGLRGAAPVKTKLIWFEATEGPFATAFEHNARKEISNGALRELLVKIVAAWDKGIKGGLVVNHPAGRDMQIVIFKGAQKVGGKPYLEIDYVSFTSDRRRAMLFLEGVKFDEITCKDEDLFELARKHILAYTERGRKTCPKSNLAMRSTFVAPLDKKDD